ncbi:MAG: hypothetical protein KIT84_34130 [Labilithrix sp.]|nr:hypothetical protein [Labilithrix sp.]
MPVSGLGRFTLTDRQLALVLSGVLFVVAAWPLALTEVPPYQDLPNHLATTTVIGNLAAYPEYTFNGFLKTNAALFTWLFFVGKLTGMNAAARLFALLVIGLNALLLPRFVLALTQSRGRMVAASLFAWPMAHNWFVSMGMLDFALAVPLSLALLVFVERQRRAPSAKNVAAIVALGVATWYAHVFPLLAVHLLVALEAVRAPAWKERVASLRAMLAPLLPATALTLLSFVLHLEDAVAPITGATVSTKLIAPWELVYNLWAQWFWGYSNLSLSSLVPCVLLAFVAVPRLFARTPAPAFFSPVALVALAVLFCFVPYKMTNWFHVNSRFIPFLWIGLLLYVPERLPRALAGVLGVSAALYSVGMGVDYVRLDRERAEFTAGIEAVPEGAKLMPLMFQHKGASANTRNLLHMWGYYVIEKKTSAPLLFAHSRSFPLTYAEPLPPARFNHLVLEAFAPEAGTPKAVCNAAAREGECDQLFASTWRRFYDEATPRYDHLLLWDAPAAATAMVPADYTRTFARGRLAIYARRDVKR